MKKLLLILTLFIFSFSAAYSAETVSGPIKGAEAFQKEQNYIYQKLPSGQNVVIVPVHTNPIVTIDTWIRTGSINENDKNSGVAHFLEHLFFKGTEKHPTGEFDRILESKGGVTNAATSKDFTHYYITIPSKQFDLALEMHADMLLHPIIPRKELEKERHVVLEEIARADDNPTGVMFNNLFKLIYSNFEPKHPYFRPVAGDAKVIETISREEILDFFNKWYSPQNMTTVIVGDIDPKSALNKVAELFVDNSRTLSVANYPKIPEITKPLRIQAEKDVNMGYMAIAYKAPKFKDEKDIYTLDVLESILGDSRSSILNRKLKEEKQLVYSVSAGYSAIMDDGLFIIQASFKPEKLKTVEDEIFKEIDRVKKEGVTDEEVKKAINMIKTSTYYSRESVSNISNEIGYVSAILNNLKYYDNYLDNIEKVTKQDVLKAARKYLDKNKTAVSIIMPTNYKEENVKEINNVKEEKPAEKVESFNGANKYTLSNGATLIIKKNPVNSIVAIDIQSIGGNFLEKTPGTASLTASLATRGTKGKASEEIAKALDERGIKLSFSSGVDTFDISLLTTTNELNFALDMLNEVVNEASFPNSEIEKVKKIKLASIKKMRDNALNIAVDEFKKTAFKGTSYGNNSEVLEKNIPNISKDDIFEFYNKILNPKNLIISVAGNVDEEKMIKEMTKIFTQREGDKITLEEIKYNQFLPNEDISKTLTKEDTKTAWIITGFKTTSLYNTKDIATIKVINAILGEGMSSRLFRNLREEKGLAYQIGSSMFQNAKDGTFVAYIGTNNKNIEVAKKGLLDEMYKLKTEYVSNKELEEAKDKILGNIILSLETNMDEASIQSWYGALGYNLDHLEEYKKAILSVTQADILAVANKYFSSPVITVVVKNPNLEN